MRNCHMLSHEIGRATYARNPRAAENTINLGTRLCGGGYQHGMIESLYGDVPLSKLGETARALCQRLEKRQLEQFCKHGSGHGAMYFHNFDIPSALALCDKIQTANEMDTCGTGVFMENQSALPETPPQRMTWLKKDDLAYPCPAMPENHKWACYRQVASRVGRGQMTFDVTAKTCASIERRHQPGCFGGFGMVAAGGNETWQGVLKTCMMAREFVDVCLGDAVGELQNMYAPDQSYRLGLCGGAAKAAATHSNAKRAAELRAFAKSIRCLPEATELWPAIITYADECPKFDTCAPLTGRKFEKPGNGMTSASPPTLDGGTE